jgi:tetratricopeptide (TPR) repeat protein
MDGEMKALIVSSLLVPSVVFACINVAGTRHDGSRIEARRTHTARLKQAMAEDPAARSALRHFGHDHPEHVLQQIKAVDMIYHGQFKEALAQLHALESSAPGQYDTAGNIGTAYELLGDNENALVWINEEIKRNPEAHNYSEWLHAHILRAKIAASRNPDLQKTVRLIDVPEVFDKDTILLRIDGVEYSAPEIWESLFHQLNERMLFVKPKDPYVADLLWSLALLNAKLGALEEALGLLKLASEYGFPDEALLSQHVTAYQAIVTKAKIMLWLKILLGLILFGLFLAYCVRKKWLFMSLAAAKVHRESLAPGKEQQRNV